MTADFNQIVAFWTRQVQSKDVSLLLAIAAVAITAFVDVLVRLGRARTTRRLRMAAAAYAQREIAKESPRRRNAVPRLSASGSWRLQPAYSE